MLTAQTTRMRERGEWSPHVHLCRRSSPKPFFLVYWSGNRHDRATLQVRNRMSWRTRTKERMECSMEKAPHRLSLFQAGSSYGNIVLNFQHAAHDEFSLYARAFHQT